ncbi:hypothetical protein MBAV_004435 [Candidatus Magnetobacterium bavaricum]|uniref:Uncharacterized protein n=1 Tax=Candidatus Magnetobacterium bavaricum TaxID=29290 RepID=A0A0F3GN41_9BACT|nr:hypothetical protein MBAV_004435 [Candidatus Magnetobacterium bavaricum]
MRPMYQDRETVNTHGLFLSLMIALYIHTLLVLCSTHKTLYIDTFNNHFSKSSLLSVLIFMS